MSEVLYPFDITGTAASNLVTREPHVLSEINSDSKRILVMVHSPFYQNNFKLEYKDVNGNFTILTEGIDYDFSLLFIGATVAIGKKLYGGVVINQSFLNGMLYPTYQTLGAPWMADRNIVLENIASLVYNPRIATWDQITNVQETFPPAPHTQPIDQFRGLEDLIASISSLNDTLSIPSTPSLAYQQNSLEVNTKIELLTRRVESLEATAARLKTISGI